MDTPAGSRGPGTPGLGGRSPNRRLHLPPVPAPAVRAGGESPRPDSPTRGAQPAESAALGRESGPATGAPLTPELAALGELLGADLSGVRVQLDSADLITPALTVRDRIRFAPGAYDPAGPAGLRLLAHELVHVIQQAGGTGATRHGTPAGAEAEADRVSEQVLAGEPAGPIGASEPGVPQAAQVVIASQGFHPDPNLLHPVPEGHYVIESTWNGDPFRLTVRRSIQPTTGGGGPIAYLKIDIAYTGGQVIDRGTKELSERTPAVTPDRRLAPVVTVGPDSRGEQVRYNELFLDVFGDGSYRYLIDDNTVFEQAWTPPIRRHTFDGAEVGSYRDPMVSYAPQTIRERGALPVADAAVLEALLALPGPETSLLTTGQLLYLAEQRLAETHPDHWAPGRDAWWYDSARRDLIAAIRRVDGATTPPADAEALRRRGTQVIRVCAWAAPALRDLAPMLRPELYLGNASTEAIRMVERVIATTVTAVFTSWSDRADLMATAERNAIRARLALPYELASLYLRSGRGIDAVQAETRAVSGDLMMWRDKGGVRAHRVMDDILQIRYGSGTMTPGTRARDLDPLREAFITSGADVLVQLVDLTQHTQREAGLMSLFALYAQLAWFTSELDSWIDTAIGIVPGTNPAQEPVARRYRDQFAAMLTEIEAAWTGTWTDAFRTTVDTVIGRFAEVATGPAFTAAVSDLDSRLGSIAVVRIVGKVLVLLAVASLAGAAAGSLAGTALTGLGRALALSASTTTNIARAGAFLAEVTVFTAVNRAGSAAVIGPNRTSFLEDFGTNFVLFRLLRFTSRVYAARWTALRRLAQPGVYAAGQAGTSLVTLQIFAEMHHLLKSGGAMSGEERFQAVFNNVVLVTAFSLGGHIARSPESRLAAPVLEHVRRLYGSRFRTLEARRTELASTLEQARRDPTSVDLGELLREIESLYNTEFQLISRAVRQGRFTPAEVQAALDAYAAPVRGLEIEFARMGLDFGTPESAKYRPLGSQLAEFAPDGLAYLRSHYAAARGEFVDIGQGMYRGTIQGETVYWIPRGGRLPTGGMRGRDVLPLAAEPVLELSDLITLRAQLVVDGRFGGLRHGADFGAIPFPDSTTMRVPLDATGRRFAYVDTVIRLQTPTAGGVHGPETGHARSDITVAGGRWRVVIDIDPRLSRENAYLGMRHEANEVAGIVRRLYESGLTGRELQRAVVEQQQAGLMRESARAGEATEHDVATAWDLLELFGRYRATPTPENRAVLDAAIRRAGFGSKYFAQEMMPRSPSATSPDRSYTVSVTTRDALIRSTGHLNSQALLDYIDVWRTESYAQTPFIAADRPSQIARLLEYTDALAGRRGTRGTFVQTTPDATMNVIEILAQTAIGRDRVTAQDLIDNGMEPGIARTVAASLGGRNAYRNLYAELESMIALRHRLADAAARGLTPADVGYGFTRTLTSVQQLTAAGPLDGVEFGELMRRIEAARRAGRLVSDSAAEPLKPRFSPAASPTSAVRLTWRFRPTGSGAGGAPAAVDSLFSIDLPGVIANRPYQIGDLVHGDLEPAPTGGGHGVEHLTETGVVVPAGSAPAHIYIKLDQAFGDSLDSWGLTDVRMRFRPQRPR